MIVLRKHFGLVNSLDSNYDMQHVAHVVTVLRHWFVRGSAQFARVQIHSEMLDRGSGRTLG